jgi:peptide/nickel transport system substrate-binding protein
MRLAFSQKTLVTAATLLLSVSLGAIITPTATLAQSHDTLVVARSMDVNSLDPHRAFCDTCQIYLSSTYETLVTLAADNKTLLPLLATSWVINADNTEFVFTLDPAAVFADGSPVEAKDVAWSFQRLQNLQQNPAFFLDGVVGVEALDAHTVKVTKAEPDSEFLNKLSTTFTGVINSDVAIANGATADKDSPTTDKAENWFLANSAGSGPFTLKNYTPDNELRLARNENYYRHKSDFSEVVITQVQDAVSQAQALESGAVDLAMQIDPDTAASMSSPDVVTEVIPSYNFVYVAFSPYAEGVNSVLTPEVRQALALAIDYDGMIDFTVGGNGRKQASPIPNGFPGSAGLPDPVQDVEKAKQMLADAGYPDGFSLTAVYPNDNIYGVDLNIMMQKLQQDFAAIGVTIDLQPQTYAVWRDQLNGVGVPVTAIYWAPDFYGSSAYVGYFGMVPGAAWSNRAGQKDAPAINEAEAELFKAALAAPASEAETAFNKVALEMIKDKIIIPLVSPNLVLAHRADIGGVRYSACCNLPLNEIVRK